MRIAATIAILAAIPVAGTAEVSLSLGFDLDDAAVSTLRYECGDGAPVTVHYLNSDTDALALVPVDGTHRVFVNVVSGSGARYVSGQYEWWTKGENATLTDVIEDKALRDCAVVSP